VELDYNSGTGWASGSVPLPGDAIEYFAQAVDPTGNVALALDHGNPFQGVTAVSEVYLPLTLRAY
jgi:hypothetical protein